MHNDVQIFDHPPYYQNIDEFIETNLVEVDMTNLSEVDRINAAVDLAWRYGGIDGTDHQKWLVDQMLRKMLRDDEYEEFVRRYESYGEYKWDIGIAP